MRKFSLTLLCIWMTKGLKMKTMGSTELRNSMAVASLGLKGRVWDVPEDSVQFQDLLLFISSCLNTVHSKAESLRGTGRQRRSCCPPPPPDSSPTRWKPSQVTTQKKTRGAAILGLRFCGRMGRERLYLKKRPLVFPLLFYREIDIRIWGSQVTPRQYAHV